MLPDVFAVLNPGLGATLQDRGRPGWRRFGVPRGGAMDEHAAAAANQLLDNSFDAAVLELLLQGAQLRVLSPIWVAITGADAEASFPLWQAVRLNTDDLLEFPRNRAGVWTYVAVEGGFQGRRWLNSVSAYPRGDLGQSCQAGAILQRIPGRSFELPHGVANRWMDQSEHRNYRLPPPFRVFPGPQFDHLSDMTRRAFFSESWTVTGQSDRVGYRLSGRSLQGHGSEIISEPIRVGSIQIPESGQPIVTMRDGPTVGGYPKLGMVHPADLSWLAQCRPGDKVKFIPVDDLSTCSGVS